MRRYRVVNIENNLVWFESEQGINNGIQYILKSTNPDKFNINDIVVCELKQEENNSLWRINMIDEHISSSKAEDKYTDPTETGLRSGRGNGLVKKLLGI